MRAKLYVSSVQRFENCERLKFHAVGKSNYPQDGADENNTYATWTPSASLEMTVTNPALLGKFNEGDTFYVDFTPAPK